MSATTNDLAPPAPVLTAPDSWLGAWATSADCAYCRDLSERILVCNRSFARKFGRTPKALVATPVSQLIHADDLPTLQATAAELTRPPHRATPQHRWVSAQGIRWFAWEEVAIVDEAGAIIAVRCVGRDITRQRIAEEQYYRLSRAVEQSPVSIVITDLDGHAQYVNSRFTTVTGLTLENILESGTEVLRTGHADEASYQQFMLTIRSGGEWSGEFSTPRSDGGLVWESAKVSCLRNPLGQITNFICLREDISERKRLELELRQAQKMESLGTMAGGIAHDFNNLLAIINGYAEFCQQGTPSAEFLQKSLGEIRRAAERATGLVKQILTFSRKTEIKFAPTDLNHLVNEIVKLLAETFPRTVTFQTNLAEQLPPLHADHNQLQQILLNFCVNARDAMPQGGTIKLSTGVHLGKSLSHLGADPATKYGSLSVGDTGTGMKPEVRARIFEPFFTTKPVNQGTGLGLAVVYGIVTAHRGFIDVESTLGVGSTFHVYLPLADVPAAAIVGPSEITWFPEGKESVLVVDDEETLRKLLSRALGQKGYRVSTASTGLEAVEMIHDPSLTFDIVLLDLNMPGANGVDVLKTIRHTHPKMKVLVVSGHISASVRSEIEQLGHREFVQKPYKLGELGRRLRSLLDNRS